MSGPANVENLKTPVSFTGLLSDSADVKSRYIFQVHGMGTLNRDEYANRLLNQFKYKHGYSPVSETQWADVPLGDAQRVVGENLDCTKRFPDCVYATFGQYKKSVFARRSKTVTIYSYFWRDDLWTIVNNYLKADVDANDKNYHFPSTKKSLVNASLKASLMDDGFGDAAGYLSPVGRLERDGLQSAVCLMFADALKVAPARGEQCLQDLAPSIRAATANDVEFDFLSHSLGSRMLYDVLSPWDPAPGTGHPDAVMARSALLYRTRNFFMAANQMPMLAVGDLTVQSTGDERADHAAQRNTGPYRRGLAGVMALRAKPSEVLDATGAAINKTPRMTVIAFQDPDDFLGFRASDAALDPGRDEPQIIDVVHRNAPQWAFLFEWPGIAHDHELAEPNSLKIILCGASSAADGKLIAKTCSEEVPAP
jgi:hypothetical protein